MNIVGLIIDIAIVLLVVVFGIIGLKKGLLKSVISLFSWVVCILVAIFTAKYVAGWLNNIYDFSGFIGNKISGGLVGTHEFFSSQISSFESKEQILASLPANLNGALKTLITVVFKNTSVDMESTLTVGNIVGASLGHICMLVITGILIFIILKLVVFILNKIFDKVAKTKVLGGLNKILGFVFGFAKGLLIVVVINIVMVALSMVPVVNNTITPILKNNTHVEKVIYNKTDEMFGKYVIEGGMLQTWITNLWQSRK